MLSATIPLSLYIHIPWCIRKCPYCDFNSHSLREDLPETAYISSLIVDLQQKLSFIEKREIYSIFIGGGTPSLFQPASYDSLFQELKRILIIAENAEITLEANPGSVEQKRFYDYRSLGINRISLGIQSFQDAKLAALGRIHNKEDAQRAVLAAQAAGFSNINLDLMFGLPQQTIADALYDLQTAINLQPQHISWYQLTLEPNTYFHRFPPQLPHDDLIWEMQIEGQALLKQNHFYQYEVSAYARDDKYSHHNVNYWEFGDYLGIGAGAHGKITNFKAANVSRHANIRHPKDYMKAQSNFIAQQKIITPAELPLEFMLNALRLYKPIPHSLFTERTGLTIAAINQQLKVAEQKKLMCNKDEKIYLTTQGRRFLNDVLEIFM